MTPLSLWLLASIAVASYPDPSRGGGERAWYTLHVHVPAMGTPEKYVVIGYYHILSVYRP